MTKSSPVQSTNADWLKRLQKIECHDATYPTTDSPLVFARGSGSHVWDVEGQQYLDMCAGFGALPLGHQHPAVRDVFSTFASDQSPLVHGMGDVYCSQLKVEFLEELRSLMPSHLTKGALALTGSQAVEYAMKTAKLATEHSGFIVFEDGYHGLDLGVLATSARVDFRAPFRDLIREDLIERLPYGCPMEDIALAITRQRKKSIGTAGVIVEPVQGRGGVNIPKDGWLKELQEFIHVQKERPLLIFDEVQTGMGRSGRITYAHEVPCDLICLGKAIGGGMPLSAVFGRKEFMDQWPKSTGEALHTGTFFGHPLSCAVGLATLRVIKAEQLWQRSLQVGREFLGLLHIELAGHKDVLAIRGQGLMVGVEFSRDWLGAEMMDRLRKVGVIALASGRNAKCLSVTPSLLIDSKELLEFTSKFKACLG